MGLFKFLKNVLGGKTKETVSPIVENSKRESISMVITDAAAEKEAKPAKTTKKTTKAKKPAAKKAKPVVKKATKKA